MNGEHTGMNNTIQSAPFLFRFAEEVSGPLLEGSFSVSNDVWMVTYNGEQVPLVQVSHASTYTQSITKVLNENTDRD